MTPEALAEIQGHTEVIRVMRAWESLHPSEPYASSEGGSETVELGSERGGESAVSVSEDGWYDGHSIQQPSRKGKERERAFSFSSAKSELSVPAIKVKHSLEGFFRRSSRSGSFNNNLSAEPSSPTPLRISTFSDGTQETTNPESPGYYSPFIDSAPSSPLPEAIPDHRAFMMSPDIDGGEGSHTPLTRVTSGDSTVLGPPMPSFRAFSPSSNRSGGSSTVLAMSRPSRSESLLQDTNEETASNASEYEMALETIEQEGSEGTDPSRRSADSGRPTPGDVHAEINGQVEEQQSPPLHIHHTMPPRHTFSSRRPSLPSILEKAAHPGQTFRNAIRRDRHASESTPTIPEDPSQPKGGTFLRGRKQSNEQPSSHHSSGRRFGTIKGFFRRGQSPPSRSPSPPKQNAIHPDELDERLLRASLDMSQSEGSSADNRDDFNLTVPAQTHSAPATKTRFFEDLSDNSDNLRVATLASQAARQSAAPRVPAPIRKVSGGVLVPSPLANELRSPENTLSAQQQQQQRQESNPSYFRRSKTEVFRGQTPSPRSSIPGSPIHTKRRSATLPSQSRIPVPVPGSEWDEGVSLRRAAASEVIRRNSEKLRQAVEEAEARTEDGNNDGDRTSIASRDSEMVSALEKVDIARGQDEEEETPHGSDGEGEEEDGDPTPEATPAIERTLPDAMRIQTAGIGASAGTGYGTGNGHGNVPEPTSSARLRGASIGSFTTDSTRLSTPSVSTNPQMSIVSYDTSSERYHQYNQSPTFATASEKIQSRALQNSVNTTETQNGNGDGNGDGNGETRPRGNTTSSESSGSGMNFSGSGHGSGLPSASTPNTSMTPPSALGMGKHLSVSPVPEHQQFQHSQHSQHSQTETLSHSSSHSQRPHSRETALSSESPRKALTREEAKNLVKQNELDILQLAQLPQSLDSSRSLAAQLAAYGENHQLEQQIASDERRAKRRAAAGKAKAGGVGGVGGVNHSDGSESYMTATSGDETPSQSGGSSSGRTTGSSALRMTTLKHDKGRYNPHEFESGANSVGGMYKAEAPKSTVPSINNIYDRRAAAYREKLQALTSISPAVPSSLRHQTSGSGSSSALSPGGPGSGSRSGSRNPSRSYSHGNGNGHPLPHQRPRAFSSTSLTPYPFSPESTSPSTSSSLRHVSSPFPTSRPKSTHRSSQHPSKYTLHPQTPTSGTSLRTFATGTAGGTGSMHTAISNPGTMSTHTHQPGAKQRRKTHPPPPIADVVNARYAGIGIGTLTPPPVPPISASPYVSIFSSKYSGAPHDGGDSDDTDTEPTRYTVIENDWRGGRVVKDQLPINDRDLKRNKWGQLKGAIGHLGGRKTSQP